MIESRHSTMMRDFLSMLDSREIPVEEYLGATGITMDDLEAELQDIADSTGTSVEDARKRWQELGLMAVITEQIMHRKTVQWLLDNAIVTIEEAPVEEAVSEGTKKKAAKKPAAKKAAAATEDTADASEE
jgi:FKBP-type peptidyl-prolyl cis-trans isomerase (trigger factor)